MHQPLATLRNRQSDTWPRSLDSKRCCSVSFTNLSWKHLTSSFPTLSDALASGHFFCLHLHPRTQSSAPEGHSLETVFSALKRLPPSSGHQLGISPIPCMSCVSSSQELSLTWGLVLLSSVSVCPLFIHQLSPWALHAQESFHPDSICSSLSSQDHTLLTNAIPTFPPEPFPHGMFLHSFCRILRMT